MVNGAAIIKQESFRYANVIFFSLKPLNTVTARTYFLVIVYVMMFALCRLFTLDTKSAKEDTENNSVTLWCQTQGSKSHLMPLELPLVHPLTAEGLVCQGSEFPDGSLRLLLAWRSVSGLAVNCNLFLFLQSGESSRHVALEFMLVIDFF